MRPKKYLKFLVFYFLGVLFDDFDDGRDEPLELLVLCKKASSVVERILTLNELSASFGEFFGMLELLSV